MIRRETDPAFINRICNSDGVRPWIDYRDTDEPMDFTPACDRIGLTGTLFLSNGEDAVGAFELTGDREWQAHTFFAATCRGRRAIDTAKAMLEWMRPHADRIWGATPLDNRKARWFNRQIGFTILGVVSESGSAVIGGEEFTYHVPAEIVELRR